ncbi:Gmad2 immunoglobulin-like domain-containing protein [Paenibacillus guangzhouensis]|uniref:Gmad2 immunoglobulin-like domain-containing protein n=1 Tax=Paenibacillus guangzhouensis TaxID=1473112 RepID=UPI0012669AC9|nr:Gmad2 immunoglobulin-like domain-containing protein [Paenibacillus guangzhouensis]
MKKQTIALFTAATLLAGTAIAGSVGTIWAQQPTDLMQQQVKEQTFRNVKLSESTVTYTIKGDAQVHEGTYHYTLKQNGKILAKGFGTASMGAPEWGKINQQISISSNKLAGNKGLTAEMYEIDSATGKQVNNITVPLNKSDKSAKNKVFRNMKLSESKVTYSVKGEAQVHEGTYHYAVKQDSKVLVKGFGTASFGAPEWGTFTQQISIPSSKVVSNKPMFLELYEVDQATGKIVNKKTIQMKQAELTNENKVFRKVETSSPVVTFTVKGEASVFEGTYQYAVKQDGKTLAKGYGKASMGGPEWGTFSQQVSIPMNKLQGNKPLTFELFEIDQATGKVVNKLVMPIK